MDDKEITLIKITHMNKNLINIENLAEDLINNIPQEHWEIAAYNIIKQANSENQEKLKAKELKSLFKKIIRNYKARNKNKDKKIIHISELLKNGKDPRWVIKDILPENCITILSGDPASFKTWSTLHFAIKIASEEKVYNHFETIKKNVLIIDEEDGIELLRQRANILSADKNFNLYFMIMGGFKTDNNEHIEELKQTIKKYRIKVIIIDSLVRIHSGEENSSKDVAKMFEELRKLTAMGVTVLINHHHRKKSPGRGYDSQPMRGSSDILAAIDCHIQIEHKDNKLIIHQTKNRLGQELKKFEVEIICEDDKMDFNYLGEDNTPASKSEEAKELIINILRECEDKMDRQEIEEKLNGKIGKNSIGEALSELVNDGEIEVLIGEKNKKTYRLLSVDLDF